MFFFCWFVVFVFVVVAFFVLAKFINITIYDSTVITKVRPDAYTLLLLKYTLSDI